MIKTNVIFSEISRDCKLKPSLKFNSQDFIISKQTAIAVLTGAFVRKFKIMPSK